MNKHAYKSHLLDSFRLGPHKYTLAYHQNYYIVAAICNRASENGRASSTAYLDPVFPPTIPSHCSKIADVWPHSLHSTTVASSYVHL